MMKYMKTWGLYEYSILIFFIAAPAAASALEYTLSNIALHQIAFKWLVFFGIGCRLGSAGIKQTLNPRFTAAEIFGIEDKSAEPVIRELGYSNICFAVPAILSLFIPSFRMPICIAGGLYYLLAGLTHVFRGRSEQKETFAMISDLCIAILLGILCTLNAAS